MMSKSRVTRNRSKKSNSAQSQITDRMLQVLKKIESNTLMELDRMVPRTPDPPRIWLRRDKVYTFNQSYTIADLSGSTAAPVGGAISVSFASISDSGSLSSIFDSYRINQATVSFTPVQAAATAGGTAPGAIYTVIDQDDNNAPTTVGDMVSYESLQITPSGSFFERTFTPRVSNALYGGSAFTSYGSVTSPWIDCASSSVPHYGLKYLINTSTQNARQWTILITVNISFRNTH